MQKGTKSSKSSLITGEQPTIGIDLRISPRKVGEKLTGLQTFETLLCYKACKQEQFG